MSRIVVTGPPGSGASLVAAALAARMRARTVDGDELHPPLSRRRQREAGVDREAWLRAVVLVFTRDSSVVISSGLLTRSDRDRIRAGVRDVIFVELVAGPATAAPKPRRWRREIPAAPRPVDPLAADEAGVRVADDADLGSVVERIHTALASAQSLR
ncbi:shikimate kinase [Microbacterium flavum]|uniref:Shikimate kinase n=1 Tax=Microbacterium flavum TaxID=415216 RepID=A0ABS5XVT8_9MICO|nr:shikimate kinase [Microbacterium flavum]MBT8797223.1 shikimate kinase [Microbacterium flavum]